MHIKFSDVSPESLEKRVFYRCPLSIANPEVQPLLGLKSCSWLSWSVLVVTVSQNGKETQSFGVYYFIKRPDFIASCWCSLADKNCNMLRNKFLIRSRHCVKAGRVIGAAAVFELRGGWGVDPPTSSCRPPYLWSKFDPGGSSFNPPPKFC